MREFWRMGGKEDIIYLIWLAGVFSGMFIPLWLVVMIIATYFVVFRLAGWLIPDREKEKDEFCKFIDDFSRIVGNPFCSGLAIGQIIVQLFGIM